jgi:uncharacterized membrane protein YqaE (UPF0057 family)
MNNKVRLYNTVIDLAVNTIELLNKSFGLLGKIFAILLICSVYLAPTGVALLRGNREIGNIFLVNFLLGWTILGWVMSFVWAVKN